MDSPFPSPLPLSGKSFFRKPLVEIGGMPHPLTESPLSISVLTIKDFEFGTLPWHLVIRVKFGISVQNWDFPGIINAKVYKCKDTRCGTKGTVEGSSAGSLSGIQAKTSRYLTKSTAVSLLLGSSKWTSLSCSSPSNRASASKTSEVQGMRSVRSAKDVPSLLSSTSSELKVGQAEKVVNHIRGAELN